MNILIIKDEQMVAVRRQMDERSNLALEALAGHSHNELVPPIPEYAQRLLNAWSNLEIKSKDYAEYSYGWPMRTLIRTEDQTVIWPATGNPSMQQSRSGLDITSLIGSPEPTILPTQILWLGFTVNSVIAAAIWALPLIVVGERRRRRRIAKGRCPMCAHDLRGNLENGCQECGWRRKTTA